MSGERLPKKIVFGNLEGTVRRRQSGREKEWTDCVQSDIRAFGITGDWKATALEAEVWVETLTDDGRRFIAAWSKEEVTRPGKVAIAHGSLEFCEATPIGPADESKES